MLNQFTENADTTPSVSRNLNFVPDGKSSAVAAHEAEAQRKMARTMAKQQQAAERIAAATGQLSAGINEAASASEELKRSSDQIATGAEEASGAAQESLAAIKQVSVAIKLGHQAIFTENGHEAVERWRQGGIDAVLMDIQMPVMSGIEALARIREEEAASGQHTPVIALTADALKGTEEKLLQAGFDGYLTKPVKTKELTDELARVTAE